MGRRHQNEVSLVYRHDACDGCFHSNRFRFSDVVFIYRQFSHVCSMVGFKV